MKKGDIILIHYPFTNLASDKLRPALIISPDYYNDRSQDILLMYITSNTLSQALEDFLISKTHPEFSLTGLKKDSLLKISKISILSKSLVRRALGQIGPQILSEIHKRLKAFLELN